jgi:hypothetical protein
MSLFCWLSCTTISVQDWGLLYECFESGYFFYGEELYLLAQPLGWKTTPCRLSATAYSIYLQLLSILEVVPLLATWGRAICGDRDPLITAFSCLVIFKVKLPCTCHEATEGSRCIMWCILNLLHLMEVFHNMAALLSGKNPSIHRILGWLNPKAGLVVLYKKKISCPFKDWNRRLSNLQCSHYTDCTLLAYALIYKQSNVLKWYLIKCEFFF